jgi:hypothetical protein
MIKHPDKIDKLIPFEQQTKFWNRYATISGQTFTVLHWKFSNRIIRWSNNWKLESVTKMYSICHNNRIFSIEAQTFCKQPSFKMDGLQDKEGRAELEGVSDSEFGDQEIIISVFGWTLYFCGELITCKSKASNSVTLSSTEVE